jgi:serine protease AprX
VFARSSFSAALFGPGSRYDIHWHRKVRRPISAPEQNLLRLLSPRGQDRLTQDSPVLIEVWMAFAAVGVGERVDLLLNPDYHADPGVLLKQLMDAGLNGREHRIAYNESHVVVACTLEELVTIVVPFSKWCQRILKRERQGAPVADMVSYGIEKAETDRVNAGKSTMPSKYADVEYVTSLIQEVLALQMQKSAGAASPPLTPISDWLMEAFLRTENLQAQPGNMQLLFNIALNRSAKPALFHSRQTVKADAANRVFDISCTDIAWAVIDTGIDAEHPAFFDKCSDNATSRIKRTFDFTRLRDIIYLTHAKDADPGTVGLSEDDRARIQPELLMRLQNGLQVDWNLLMPCLEITHTFCAPLAKANDPLRTGPPIPYSAPTSEHGTHVAGILGADWKIDATQLDAIDALSVNDVQNLHEIGKIGVLQGICPDIEIYDLRVFDDKEQGDEFAILAALQFVRFLNASRSKRVIHGINLSLSLEHKVRSYACGRTPICDECDRAVASGLVVVAAAGNTGYQESETDALFNSYRSSSITDPGNADTVLTVGSTHRDMPHSYGVSYFSSRGPTGDGRAKPDLVAPGEKVFSTIPGGNAVTKDGTSMAAPHVSGAAALLMARHSELIGQPARIKKLLCDTAIDLGRVPEFQGAGLLDILRALESV